MRKGEREVKVRWMYVLRPAEAIYRDREPGVDMNSRRDIVRCTIAPANKNSTANSKHGFVLAGYDHLVKT